MGRQVVRLASGENISAYLVDEDKESYTFRKDIRKPEEFRVMRDDVIFIARMHPASLSGLSGKNRLYLNWNNPYLMPKFYQIYTKGPNQDSFLPAGKSSINEFTLTGILSGEQYEIYVTAVYDDGYESPPGNILKIQNNETDILPPEDVKCRRINTRDSYSAEISWRAPSGGERPASYAIYRKKGGTYTRIGDTRGTSFTVNNLARNERHVFVVRSVSGKGQISYNSDICGTDSLMLYFRAGYASPLLLETGDKELNRFYSGDYGLMTDIFFYEIFYFYKGIYFYGYDFFGRLSIKSFSMGHTSHLIEYDSDLAASTIRVLSLNPGIRFFTGMEIHNYRPLLYFFAAPGFARTEIKAEISSGTGTGTFYSLGINYGAGIELSLPRYTGFFIEYSNGYTPTGDSGANIEGHQLWAGMSFKIPLKVAE